MRKMVVAEAYSMPRVTKLAQEMGHESAGAYDINNGFDFTTQADRRRCFEELVRMDPDVLLVSPPCGPFSIIQELNYPKMGQRRAIIMLAEGVSHLEFAMKLFQWQVMRGRLAIFEHPATSKGWDEPCVEKSAQMNGVERVRADQCAYGLRVKDELNKKPTDFLVNGKSLAKHLSKRCSGQHVHEALMGGLALKAQHYPKALCKAMITGAEEDSAAWRQVWATEGENEEEKELKDALDEEVEAAGAPVVRLGPPREVEEDAPGEAEEDVIEGGMSREDKKLVQKMHNNLGHPGRYEFCRAPADGKSKTRSVEVCQERVSLWNMRLTAKTKSCSTRHRSQNF